jgi:hypothetical protein
LPTSLQVAGLSSNSTVARSSKAVIYSSFILSDNTRLAFLRAAKGAHPSVEAAASRRDRAAEAISRRFIIPEGLLNRPERVAGENLQYQTASVLCFYGCLFNSGQKIEFCFAAILDAPCCKITAQRIVRHIHNFDQIFLCHL